MKTRLYQIRKELQPKVSQEKLAFAAGVSRQWYHRLETGKQERISYTTARNILNALNAERQARNLSALTLDQLNLRIV
jgi:transcriptional regulator with XRE-family HTH domain